MKITADRYARMIEAAKRGAHRKFRSTTRGDFRVSVVHFVDGDRRVCMRHLPSGRTHTLLVDCTPIERLQAHLAGFVTNCTAD